MALTDVQKIRLECGLVNEAESLLSDDEIQYFLTKNNNSIKKASLDAAKTVLFILSQTKCVPKSQGNQIARELVEIR